MTRVLVTGGAGFIGTHLCRALTLQRHSVTVLDVRQPTAYVPTVQYVQGDVRDDALVGHLMKQTDQTYHLAAVVGFANVMTEQRKTIQTSTEGTATVLHHACLTHQPVLLTSTSACYGRGKPQEKVREDADGVLGPTWKTSWSYAYAKACDETLAFSYHAERGLPVTVARLFNTVGPGQSADAGFVLPRFVGQALRGDPLTVHTPGSQTRTFAHVSDTVRGLIGLMDCPQARGELVNVGGTENWAMTSLAERVIDLLGSKSRVEMTEAPYHPNHYDNVTDRMPDLTKIFTLTGYAPMYTMDDMIQDTARELTEARA